MIKQYNTLVISGGSVKSITALGAIQYCMDNNLINDIDTYIGTSAGALISYLLAIGYSPTELLVYLCVHDIFHVDDTLIDIRSMIAGEGAMDFSIIQEHLEKLSINKIGKIITFKELKDMYDKTVVCVTYNYNKNETEYMSYKTTPDMPVITAVRMSSSIPFIFNSFKYEEYSYIDGSISNNFPIKYTLPEVEREYIRLGICVNMSADYNEHPINMFEYFLKLLYIPMIENNKIKLKSITDIDIITINNIHINIFNFNLSTLENMELFSKGYQVASEFFKDKH